MQVLDTASACFLVLAAFTTLPGLVRGYNPFYVRENDVYYYNRVPNQRIVYQRPDNYGTVVTAYSSNSNPCSPSPCGKNTECLVKNERPVCLCLPGHFGNPLSYCQRGECSDDQDCGYNKYCRNSQCVDVCAGMCGSNALCTAKNRVPVCSCPAGMTGDPLKYCRQYHPQERCTPSPCGQNTRCEVVNDVPTCICLQGYIGDPISGCRHECDSDYDCGPQSKCSNFKCTPVCTAGSCAANAICEASGHRAVCKCPPGLFGDPYTACNAECESHYDCPGGRPACSAGKCIDPCAQGVCGINANCRVRDRTTPVCSCPRDMTGDPFVSCRPFEKSDLCVPNPCGQNAQCTPGHDRTGRERPVCTCLPGYLGDALTACRRGECSTNLECSYDKVCTNFQCRSVCEVGACGHNARCDAREHSAVCTCPSGMSGNPLVSCHQSPTPVAATRREDSTKKLERRTVTEKDVIMDGVYEFKGEGM